MVSSLNNTIQEMSTGEPDVFMNSSGLHFQNISFALRLEASNGAFAALCSDGRLVTWGHPDFGGEQRVPCLTLTQGLERLPPYFYPYRQRGGRVGDGEGVSCGLQAFSLTCASDA